MVKYISWIVVWCAVVSLLGCTSSGEDVKTGACSVLGLNDRIASGTACSEQNSPVVLLTILPTEGGVSLCSGTMITRKHILTAAHCFDFKDGVANISARVNGVDQSAVGYTSHPSANLDEIPPQNDVAIVELGSSVDINPVPLILSNNLEPDQIISIFGFGGDDEEITGVLRSGQMKVTGINSQFFFALFSDEGSNVCPGDSGGPAIISYKNDDGDVITGVVGVTSFGTGECSSAGSSGFTNLQGNTIIDFIVDLVPGAVVM